MSDPRGVPHKAFRRRNWSKRNAWLIITIIVLRYLPQRPRRYHHRRQIRRQIHRLVSKNNRYSRKNRMIIPLTRRCGHVWTDPLFMLHAPDLQPFEVPWPNHPPIQILSHGANRRETKPYPPDTAQMIPCTWGLITYLSAIYNPLLICEIFQVTCNFNEAQFFGIRLRDTHLVRFCSKLFTKYYLSAAEQHKNASHKSNIIVVKHE